MRREIALGSSKHALKQHKAPLQQLLGAGNAHGK